MKNYGKKALSVLLAVLMCLTVVALDFSSLTAGAYTASPTHTFKIQLVRTYTDGGYDGQDGGGTMTLYGKNQNGNGTQGTISSGGITSSWAYTDSENPTLGPWTSTYWPTSMYIGVNICKNNSMFYKEQTITTRVDLYVQNAATGGWEGPYNIGSFSLTSDTTSGGGGSSFKSTTITLGTAGRPAASKVATSYNANGNATDTVNITLNATGGANQTQGFNAYVYDQYNVIWTAAPSAWSKSGTVACTTSLTTTGASESNTLTMSATNATYQKATCTVKATYGSLYHQWNVVITPTYKINFNVSTNGGTSTAPGSATVTNGNTGSVNTSYTLQSSQTASKSNTTTGTWTFEGWNGSSTATSGTKPTSAITIDNYNDTLYAIFSRSATATFHWYNSSGTKVTSTNSKTVYNNATSFTFDVPKSSVPTTITVNGTNYTFAGWAVDSTTKTTADHAASVTTATRNINTGSTYNFYALYTASVTLSYNNNGGSGAPAAQTGNLVLNCGANATAANNTSGQATFTINPNNTQMSRSYSSAFVGWNTTQKDDETAQYKDGTVTWSASSGLPSTITIKKNTTLYASYYDFRYNVKFYDYSGSLLKQQTVRHNYSATAPAMKTNASDPSHTDSGSHYVFDHWEYTDGSAYADSDKLTVNTNGYTYEVWGKYVGHKHIWGEPYNLQGATTCTTGVTYKADCTVCGYTRSFEEDPLGHDFEVIGVAAPTCTKNGSYGKKVCRNCGASDPTYSVVIDGVETLITDENRVIPALGHDYGNVDFDHLTDTEGNFIVEPITVEATCTTAGYYYYECARCGEITRVGNIPATGHDWDVHEEVPATCTETGIEAYTVCKNCGLYLVGHETEAERVLPALGHDYVLVEETDSTCTEKGHYEYYECSRCGKLFDADKAPIDAVPEKDPAPHDYQFVDHVDATCTEAGYTGAWLCSVCGQADPDKEPGEVIPALGHDLPDAWTVVTAATCAAPGEEKRECSRCDYVETREIPALQHEQGEYIAPVEPTCTEDGHGEGYYCANCDGYYQEPEVIAALGHDLETVAGTPATCTEDGIPDCYKCTRCNKLFSDANGKNEITEGVGTIPALGHNFTDWVVAVLPTDTEKGLEKRRCIRCGIVEERDIDALGHDMTFVPAKDATCTEDGNVAYYECANCGKAFADEEGANEIENVVIAALGHDLPAEPTEAVAATCVADGYNKYVCARCNLTVIETIPQNNEHPADAIVAYGANIPATCAAPGQEAGTMCSLCGTILTKPKAVAKLAHTPEDDVRDAKAATCTEVGFTGDLYCAVCGQIITAGTAIEAKGHHLGELVEVKAATCTEYGEKRRTCVDCDYYESTETPVLGHQIVNDKAVAATCDAAGKTAGSHCARCGEVIVAQADISAKGHAYKYQVVEPTCTTVGYTVYTCVNGCGDTYRDNYTAKLDHVVGTPATCTDPAVCANCGRSFGTVIDHDYEVVSNTDSTCTVAGVRTYRCTMCGDTYTETKELLDHRLTTADSYGVEPTCTERGYSAMKCEMCGEYIIEYDDAPLGHDYQNGVCTRCGEKDPNFVPDGGTATSEKCPKCGMNHNGRTGLWKQDGLFCKIIGFFRNLFKGFGR